MKRIGHWIDGRAVSGTSGRTAPVYNPATGEQTGEVDLASAAEVDAAVTVAHAAFPEWRATPLSRRAEVLFRMRELWTAIDEADVPEDVRLALFEQASTGLQLHIADLLRCTAQDKTPGELYEMLQPGLAKLEAMVDDLLRQEAKAEAGSLRAELEELNAPREIFARPLITSTTSSSSRSASWPTQQRSRSRARSFRSSSGGHSSGLSENSAASSSANASSAC